MCRTKPMQTLPIWRCKVVAVEQPEKLRSMSRPQNCVVRPGASTNNRDGVIEAVDVISTELTI
jgi:hypothetical protein